MSDHLPALLFLLPFMTAISLPMVGLKHREWCRPMVIAAVSAMSVASIANIVVVMDSGEIRYAFSQNDRRTRAQSESTPVCFRVDPLCVARNNVDTMNQFVMCCGVPNCANEQITIRG